MIKLGRLGGCWCWSRLLLEAQLLEVFCIMVSLSCLSRIEFSFSDVFVNLVFIIVYAFLVIILIDRLVVWLFIDKAVVLL